MIGAWTINVGGRLYGPFSSERMRSFASEGRLAATSLVAREDTSDWLEARDEPEFADLFSSQTNASEGAEPAAGPALAASAAPPTPAHMAAPAAESAEMPEGHRAHFTIVVDMKSRGLGSLENAISSLGPAYHLLPNVWIVSTDQSVGAVRNRLIQELGKSDSLFVVDASRGKAAWFNFGPDADVRIRRVWKKTA